MDGFVNFDPSISDFDIFVYLIMKSSFGMHTTIYSNAEGTTVEIDLDECGLGPGHVFFNFDAKGRIM